MGTRKRTLDGFYLVLKILIAAGTLAAVFVLVSPSANQVSAQSGDRMATGYLPAASRVKAVAQPRPPALPAAQVARLESAQARMHRQGLRTPASPLAPLPSTPRQVPATTPRSLAPESESSPAAPRAPATTFQFFSNTELGAGAPSANTSVVGEPSVGNNGPYVFETGNWYAALSSDNGTTFTFVNPYTTFPTSYGGFCCDQVVLYDPSRDLVFWLLLYLNNSSGNILRLAVANGQTGLGNLNFHYYDLAPQAMTPPFPAGDWYDYPYLALSNNYLYISTNVFKSDNSTFDGTAVLRLPLDSLTSGNSISYNAYLLDKTQYFNATMTQGATTTIYWATHQNNATMRIYNWPENGPVSATNVAHTQYPSTLTYLCPGPDGRDWCGRLDDRVLTGWVSNGLMGFMWNAPQGTVGSANFAYPYIQTLLVNESGMTLSGESFMSNPNYAFAYAGAGVNARGHVAGTVFFGGGSTYPSLAAFIWDDYSPNPYPAPPATWETYTVAASSQGPNSNSWGDYLSARQNHAGSAYRYLWIATGYSLVGGGSNSNARPRFLSFGRARDTPLTGLSPAGFLPLILK